MPITWPASLNFGELWANAQATLALTIFNNSQGHCLFDSWKMAPPFLSLQEYGLTDFKTRHVASHDGNGTDIGIWYRKPDDDGKPVYVLFHGRSGHWGSVSPGALETPGSAPVVDPSPQLGYRLQWLKAIAATGAGVVAVHTRGCGLSRSKSWPPDSAPITEKHLRGDMAAVSEFLQQQGIRSERCIVAGESLGGAMAAMMAESMPEPPAVLALVNTFGRMADTVHHHMSNTNVLEYVPFNPLAAIKWKPGQHAKPQHLDDILKKSDRRFATEERLRDTINRKTHCYIAYTPDDEAIPAYQGHHSRLAAAAEGMKLTVREITPELRRNGFAHVSWDAKAIVEDMQRVYAEARQTQPSTAAATWHVRH